VGRLDQGTPKPDGRRKDRRGPLWHGPVIGSLTPVGAALALSKHSWPYVYDRIYSALRRRVAQYGYEAADLAATKSLRSMMNRVELS
jgi:hypothetical protein